MIKLRKCFFLLILCIFLLVSSSALGFEYAVRDLGTLEGKYRTVQPAAINEKGQVAGTGYGYDSSGNHFSMCFIWDNENGVVEIGSFGGSESQAMDISDTGHVVGYSDYPGGPTEFRDAFLWEDGSLFDLGNGYASGINNNNLIAGVSPFGTGVVWQGVDIKTVFGDDDTRPSKVNDQGQVTGSSYGAGESGQAFIWHETTGIQYLDLIPGYRGSRAEDINKWGQLAGHAWADTYPHAHRPFMWNNGTMIYLGGEQGRAWGINDVGQVVRQFSETYGATSHGFIYDIDNRMRDLNDLVIPGHEFELITSAQDINNIGQIAAYACIDVLNGPCHAVILTPVSGPVPAISVFPRNYDFEKVLVGNLSDSLEIIISNYGEVDLNILGMNLSDTINFILDGYTSATVIPGGSHVVNVNFNPQSSSQFSTTLKIFSDDPDEPNVDVQLTGEGEPIIWGCITLRGVPMANAEVHLNQKGGPIKYTNTDANGCFEFESLIKDMNSDIKVKIRSE